MCEKHNISKIDKCMINLINLINVKCKGIKTLACCCGHYKYPITIVVTNGNIIWELMSNKIIPRKKRFYIKDDEGYYYIPETILDI